MKIYHPGDPMAPEIPPQCEVCGTYMGEDDICPEMPVLCQNCYDTRRSVAESLFNDLSDDFYLEQIFDKLRATQSLKGIINDKEKN